MEFIKVFGKKIKDIVEWMYEMIWLISSYLNDTIMMYIII